MRISSLSISNFRSIRTFNVTDLSDAVVVAGPNGCGKSSIFDAIRLIKSSYGQYRPGELQQWFAEFQISLNRVANSGFPIENEKMFFDRSKPIEISAIFCLSDEELQAVRDNAMDLYKSIKLTHFLRNINQDTDIHVANPVFRQTDREIVENEALKLTQELMQTLSGNEYRAKLTMRPGQLPEVDPSPLITLLFSLYRPSDWGVIDFHAPTRNYGREQLTNVQLNVASATDKSAQHALYQTAQKYTNIKQEMASSYLMELIADAAGEPTEQKPNLQETLSELFASFFPGKSFVGVLPKSDGSLEFPVELENGIRHDINELSSGEKEVLLGYLRLRSSTPKRSILLLDEPEMHLNPRLARSLPRFYEKYLSRRVGNQIWMVTHSDAILREAVTEPGYDVFHMQAAFQTPASENQATRVSASAETETAIISLTGDLATYNPRSKVVLLEGENSEFDLQMISQLFPLFAEVTNPVSLGSSRNVKFAHRILSRAANQGKLGANFFSIVDRDYHGDLETSDSKMFRWDRYHIENYLLEPSFVFDALQAITAGKFSDTEEEVRSALKEAARKTIEDTVRIQVTDHVNSILMSGLSLSYNSSQQAVEDGLLDCIARSAEKVTLIKDGDLSRANIVELTQEIRQQVEKSFDDETWMNEVRGRNVLKMFVNDLPVFIQYEQLRSLIISRMKERDFQPKGMKSVLDEVLSS